jgi:catechol 2,3-dioxygenase-like lactoylglutathione lyase family enzyme
MRGFQTLIAALLLLCNSLAAVRAEALFDLNGIDHIAVNVTDLEISTKWYADVFGFRVLHRWTTTVMVGRGNMKIGLFQRPKAGMVDDIDNKLAFTHAAFLVDGDKFDNTLAQVKSMGIAVDGPEDSGIALSFFFRDPDGHQMEVTTYYGVKPVR